MPRDRSVRRSRCCVVALSRRARGAVRRRGGAPAHRGDEPAADAMQRQLEDRLARARAADEGPGPGRSRQRRSSCCRRDIAKLRGQIEVLTYELEQSQKRQRDLYVDLDTRLRKIETAPAADAAAPPTPVRPPRAARRRAATARRRRAPPPAAAARRRRRRRHAPPARNSSDGVAEQRAYDAALDQFKRGDYAGAISGLQRVRQDVSAQPARVVGAVLGRQRAVRATRLPRRRSPRSGRC